MKRIFVSSPYREDIEKNTADAIRYARFVMEQQMMPIAPHLYFPRFLNEANVRERNMGIQCGLDLMKDCNEMWMFGRLISSGMEMELKRALELGITVKWFDEQLNALSLIGKGTGI